jgi:hypothetical protein
MPREEVGLVSRAKRRVAAVTVPLLCGAVWLACAWAGVSEADAAQGESVTTGSWGGEQIRMEVTDAGATIEYACARGTIDHQLVTGAGGRFTAKGTYVRERGGPEGEGEREREEGARALYTGRTDGKTMTFTVRLTGTNEEFGPFKLAHGKKTRVTKCM